MLNGMYINNLATLSYDGNTVMPSPEANHTAPNACVVSEGLAAVMTSLAQEFNLTK